MHSLLYILRHTLYLPTFSDLLSLPIFTSFDPLPLLSLYSFSCLNRGEDARPGHQLDLYSVPPQKASKVHRSCCSIRLKHPTNYDIHHFIPRVPVHVHALLSCCMLPTCLLHGHKGLKPAFSTAFMVRYAPCLSLQIDQSLYRLQGVCS
jgi:hypothetical protein